MNHDIQLLGISNAIVDVLAHVDHDFLETIGAEPGSMTLIDKDRAKEVYNMMGPATEMSGGSVANTVAGFANLGGSAAYIGKVRNDQLGRIFNHDMKSLGIDVRLPRAEDGAPTARSHPAAESACARRAHPRRTANYRPYGRARAGAH